MPFIVAEGAQGFEGDATIALLLVRAAAKAGADAIKFQVIFADDVAVPNYQHYDLFQSLEMSADEWAGIRDEARGLGIAFYTDIAGPRAAQLAIELSVDGFKIHSTCFFETSLFDWALNTGRPVLVSVGGIGEDEITAFVGERNLKGTDKVTIMHGYQAEPTPTERNSLARIPELRDKLGVDIGFMDHADGGGPDTVTLSAMALALGVTVFEKHITLDRTLELEDYVSALGPQEFGEYVAALKRLAGALGDKETISDEEVSYRENALKRVAAARRLSAGQTVAENDIVLKRLRQPKGYFDPRLVIGQRLVRSIEKGDPVCRGDVQ